MKKGEVYFVFCTLRKKILFFQIIRERKSLLILLTILSVYVQYSSSFDPRETKDVVLKKAIYLAALKPFLFHFSYAFDSNLVIISEVHTKQPQVSNSHFPFFISSFLKLGSTWCGEFSVTQIFREINFGESRSAKTAVFAISEALNC